MARALDALGVDIIEAGFPIASPADSEAVRQIARRSAAAGDRRAGALPRRRTSKRRRAALAAGRALADPHVPRHLRSAPRRASCASRARSASSGRRRRSRCARQLHRRCGVFGGGCDAQRSRFPVPRRSKRSIAAGATTVNLPDTVGYATPDETARVLRRHHAARAERRPGDLQRALPRRPRARRRQQPRRASRAASARSSARSTASASAPATRRSRSS